MTDDSSHAERSDGLVLDVNARPDPGAAADAPLARFLEHVRQAFSHDLRTPLGTIVNYAAVLEATPGAEAEEVRDLGRRIRGNAQRTSRMVQLLANATGLASRPLRPVATDLLALANSVITDVAGRGRVSLAAGSGDALVDVDVEVVGFAWRAFAAVTHDSGAKPTDEAELEVQRDGQGIVLELRCCPSAAGDESSVDLAAFLRHNGGPDRLESSLGLRLAHELFRTFGGELRVSGLPAGRSGLHLRLPTRV